MFADQCKFEHDCTECRKTKRFGVGQNLYIYKQSQAAPNNWEGAVADWYSEVKDFNSRNIEPFSFTSNTGHYTQVVWAETDRVGCGATSYKDGRWFTTLYVCNYGPNGNFIRGQMYKQGEPCTECDRGYKCSTEFQGLCEEGVSSSSNKVTTPSSNIGLPEEPSTKRPRPSAPGITTPDFNFVENDIAGQELFACNFDDKNKDCAERVKGEAWTMEALFGKQHLKIELENGASTQLAFLKQIPTPQGSVACLDFRFQKSREGTGKSMFSVSAVPVSG